MKAPRLSLVVSFLCMLMLVAFALTTMLARPVISNAQGPTLSSPAQASASLVDSSFTYQGQLKVNGEPYNGVCDVQFALFDTAANGQQLGATQTVANQLLSNGLFTVLLNSRDEFGLHVFDGAARWLEVSARCGGEHYFRPLAPRQALTAAPYAHSLQPGAVILGNLQTPLLGITNTVGAGIYARSDKVGVPSAPESGGWAVVGEAPYKAGVGVYGHAGGGWGIGVSGHGMTGVSGEGNVGVRGTSVITDGVGVDGFSGGRGGVGVNGDGDTGVRGISTLGGVGVSGVSYGVGSSGKTARNSVRPEDLELVGVYGSSQTGVFAQGDYAGVFATVIGSGTPLIADTPVTNTTLSTADIAIFSQNGQKRARVDVFGRGYFNGGTQTGGANVAEFVAASDAPAAGDVVEIDPDREGQFRLAATPNSTAVAGVISTHPGVSLNAKDPAGADHQAGPQLALVGRVPVKVSAENGPIRPGDLLVASATRGHAMRAPSSPAPGTVIGKALGSLDGGIGIVEMLVMLR